MNLRSIEYFLVTVEEMNFTAAAKRLFITQQALSSHIQRIEEEYTVKLFDRKPALRLTEEGKQMVFFARRVLEEERNLRVALADISKNCRNTLTVGMSRLRSDLFFPLIYSYYNKTHPNISVNLADGNTHSLNRLLQEGKIDMYIGVDTPDEPNQRKIALASEKMQCCMSLELLQKYHPDTWREDLTRFRANKGIYLADILDMPIVTMRRGNRLRDYLDFYLSRKATPNIIFEGNQQNLIYELCKSNVGVGLLSPTLFYQRFHEIAAMGDAFFVFPVLDDIPAYSVYLVYRIDYPSPRYLMDYIQTTCMVFRNYMNTIESR